MLPIILGLEGKELTGRECEFIKAYRPVGFLLFARNIESVEQSRRITDELKAMCPNALIGVDQEGGRVQRLTFHGRYPAARAYGNWYGLDAQTALEANRLQGMLLAADVAEIGANWVYAPCLDKAHENTHAIIGDRSYGADADTIIALARALLQGISEGGCHGCIKHAPGQGRAKTDSHHELPFVAGSREEIAGDLKPFQTLAPECPFLMTAHLTYEAFGSTPATLNPAVIRMMRDDWHAKGWVIADDLGMQALSGTYPQRLQAALAAGCDTAICSFSRLKIGMAGTTYAMDDAESLFAVAQDIPAMTAHATEIFKQLPKLQVPTAQAIEQARTELARLWAGAPAEIGYTWAA